jgi:hypothetical protein
MDEVRADPARAPLVQVDRFDLDARQATDARADRHAGAQRGLVISVRPASSSACPAASMP